jgi:uncharacterized protein (TIGR03435 family)
MPLRSATASILALGLMAAQRPEFEAASIRLDNGPFVPGIKVIQGGPGTDDPGRITYRRMQLAALIYQAYDVSGDQVIGITGNPQSERFMVTAAFPRTTTKEQFRAMLQNLLADRFHLALHRETRDFPGYEVMVAAGGPKFQTWNPDPNAVARIPGSRLQPGQSGFDWIVKRDPPMIHVISRQSMADFALELPGISYMAQNARGDSDSDPQESVMPRFVDKTGLSGLQDLNFDFEGAMVPGRPSAGGPTLAEALEKQLGLKLVKVKRVPVDVLVIDHADKLPTEN